MINEVSKKLTNKFVDSEIIDSEDNDIYVYGLQLFLATILKGTGIFVVAFILGYAIETTIFIIFFSILRISAGGYHSKSYLNCFSITIFFIFISISIAKLTTLYDISFFTPITVIISAALVYKFAPIDTPNKQLNSNEYNIYRRRSIRTIICQSLLIIMFYFFSKSLTLYCNIASMAIFIESITLIPFGSKYKKIINEEEVK